MSPQGNVVQHIVTALTVALLLPSVGAGEDDLSILTFPIGLVVGEHLIDVDLGAGREPATLVLDGEIVCTPTAASPRCIVDLGDAPHVHLLELIRRDAEGRVTTRARRWINRPGQEAELTIQLKERDLQGICSGRLIWLHPLKKDPVVLDIDHNGRQLRMGEDGRSFSFPCIDPNAPNLLAASAVFPDGRRAEAVTLTGGFGGREGVDMTAVSLVAGNPDNHDCGALAGEFDPSAETIVKAGFEVVFVLDPNAGYRNILSSAGTRWRTGSAWRRADASLFDADKIWFVKPNAELHRINGFGSNTLKGYRSSSGKLDWLINLFGVATSPFKDDRRLADAVATSGLVAAAGPRRRAIALVLGNTADRDASIFSATQAQAYLAEIGVPLLVIRTGKLRDDGWPTGIKVHTMHAFATTLEHLKESLDQQCIVWIRGHQRLDRVAEMLPQGLEIAGRRNGVSSAAETTR